ncbi:ABC transporter substrate-binding protein [Caproiciproducens sp.]
MKGTSRKTSKILAMLLALSMIVPLSACGGSPSAASGASAGTGSAAGSDASPKGDILFGVSTAITGAAPLEGERTKQGIDMAVEEINAAGGVLGKNLKAEYEDDANTAGTAVNVVNKLGSNPDVVCLFGPHRSTNAIAVLGSVAKNKIPFLTGGSSPSLINSGNPYLFRIRASDSFVAKIISKYAVEKLHGTKIALLYNNDDYGVGGKDVILADLKSRNITPVVCEGHNTGDKDMTSVIEKAKNAGADCLIVYTHDPEAAILARQVVELGLDVPKIGPTTYVNETWLSLVDEKTAENWYSVTDFIPSNTDEKVATFVKKFKEKYNVEPDLFASSYYNATYLLADALKRAGTADREKLQQELLKTKDFPSIYGNMSANEHGELIHDAVVAQIHDKKAVYVEKVTE